MREREPRELLAKLLEMKAEGEVPYLTPDLILDFLKSNGWKVEPIPPQEC